MCLYHGESADEAEPIKNQYSLISSTNELDCENCDMHTLINIGQVAETTAVDTFSSRNDYSPVSTMESCSTCTSKDRVQWAGPQSSSGAQSADCRMVAVAPLEPVKWVFLLCFLVSAGLSNWAVLAYTHDFVPREPLSDILFKVLPEQEWASRVGDWMVTVCLLFLLLLLFFHQSRSIIARRVVFIASTLYAMRSCTLLVTQLPPGYENNTMRCRERINSSLSTFLSRLGEQTIRLGFQEKVNMLCGDLLFSGHTLVMITCALSVSYYLPSRLRPIRWLVHLSALVGMTCMIISRTHYTIDIVIAYWLSSFVFRMYHAYCEVDVYLERSQSVLHGIWLFRIVGWLENSIVPGKIENAFVLPCSSLIRSVIRSPGHHKQISISSSSTFNLP